MQSIVIPERIIQYGNICLFMSVAIDMIGKVAMIMEAVANVLLESIIRRTPGEEPCSACCRDERGIVISIGKISKTMAPLARGMILIKGIKERS